MTDGEWLTSADPRQMLQFLSGKATDRKLRLLGCGCCRRVWPLLPDPANRDLVAAVEDRPDGTADDPALWAAIEASSRREREWVEDQGYWAVKHLGRSYYKVGPLDSAVTVVLTVRQRVGEAGDAAAEGTAQAGLLRCVFGNPFRTVAFDPRWRSADVLRLARGVYEDRAFDRLPLLADALMDAGCDSEAILAHCRGEGPHVRGCWVVDLVLGSE